ncbi:Soluble lytic murein transglycosylase precursor [Enhygromyxa salina]|uniref:Soluble lytic murein transglycosylase n=1 Tax=Enhygromyxa salina TaxID=215803 RepID=A0A2S9XER6_9BACT|nr:lytic transglycosylase domain-containing protein [Enhygromyxa salina]PRP91337.1 Soluble lytic murein transglycosylase precursor [Enhygromyxa salina]
MRLSSNLHFGLALGIATAGVILALGGCVAGGSATTTSAVPASGAEAGASKLAQFSDSERERILAVQGIVERAAAEHQLDPTLINAMIWVESRFEPTAKSSSGARGLMQLMPATAAYLAKRMGERSARAYDPEFNVRAGALYLAEMIEKFGDEQQAVAAYHAGPGNVRRWVDAGEAFPDYSQAYVAKVMDARARFEGVDVHGRPSGARAPAVAAKPGPKTPPQSEPEPLVAPELDTLQDAAEIHGVPRVIREQPQAPAPTPEPQTLEPVFEVHPEFDRDRGAPPPGWRIAKPRPKPASKPAAKQARPDPAPSQDAGLGVLPDL